MHAAQNQDEALVQGIADMARQALADDPVAAEQLAKYEAAVVALEKARAQEKELERLMREASKQAAADDAAEAAGARAKADQLMADAEVAAAEKLVRAAEIRMQQAQQQLSAAGREADRTESAKAGAIAAAGGALGALPFATAGAGGAAALLTVAASAAACFLFGVTYRYAVRQDASNSHLRGGVVAAFGLARAIGGADILQANAGGALDVAVVGNAALYSAQSMLTVMFAAVALEAAFGGGVLKRMASSMEAPPPSPSPPQ